MKPKLQEKDFQKAAKALNCDVAAIKAVAEVESKHFRICTFRLLCRIH